MKVLLVANNLREGGAAVGANNLLKSLEAVGHEVIAVDKYYDPGIKGMLLRLVRNIERFIEKIFFFKEEDAHFIKIYKSTLKLKWLVDTYQPDVIQLGFVAGNIIDFRELSVIDLPIVMRISDFWPFTGPFHYPVGYLECNDSGFRLWLADRLLKQHLDLDNFRKVHFVAPSKWSFELLSGLIGRERCCTYIPNAVHVNEEESICRVSHATVDLSTVAVRVVVVAGDLSEPRKGVNLFIMFLTNALKYNSLNWVVTLVGSNGAQFEQLSMGSRLIVKAVGRLSKNEVLRLISKNHFLACPSLLDNSPNVVCEALAQGVPIICQSGTGSASYVKDGCSGLIFDFTCSNADSVISFSRRLLSIDYSAARLNAFNCAKDYSFNTIGRHYTRLYEQLK
ncbi:glycosyltransferase [Teredinibacter turnerae]|uniref:glycosyltransferase n=1 Tax=Teredinibacter turnerae TaxID=2426 RepID=UPI00042721F0|nr:glycosyltransferase [Teredinibacter turnerae]